MTEPIHGVSGAEKTHTGSSFSGNLSQHHKKKEPHQQTEDLVELSSEVRKQRKPPAVKSIFEYLKSLFG